jgi:hypothetical protein
MLRDRNRRRKSVPKFGGDASFNESADVRRMRRHSKKPTPAALHNKMPEKPQR